ncbi:MAG: hypothetical protein JWL57_3247 [Actinobacteria bacterium]|jgi:hypothetical protein|nr:hypothetical protein [Actinomycetota bacterium]
MLSRAVLVYEERHFRDVAVEGVYSALAAEARKLRIELKSLEERAIIRLDILMEELWRRMEGVGARQATEIQRLSARLDDLQAQSAGRVPEFQRLAAQMAEAQAMAAEVAAIRLSGGSAAPDPTARWEAYVKELQGFEPVADLTAAGGFLEVASTAGLAAYVVDGDPVQHLRSVADGTLGGAFCGEVPEQRVADLMAELSRALRPGGVAIFETSDAVPPALSVAARAAGLDIEDNGSSLPLDGRLGGVSEELSDPALREIALGINGLVGRLNDVLHGPQEHGLVARRPG